MNNVSPSSSTGRAALSSPPRAAHTEPGAGVWQQRPPQGLGETLPAGDRPVQARGGMAPRANLPLALSGTAAPQSPAADASEASLASAQRAMAPLVDAYDKALLHLRLGEFSRDALEDSIHAAKDALDHYAGLPRPWAVRTLPDSRVRDMHDLLIFANREIHSQLEAEADALGAKAERLHAMLDGLIAANHQRAHHEQIDLSALYASLADVDTTYLQLWADCAARLDLMIPSLSRVAHVLGTTPQLREAEDAALRQLTAHLATARLMGLMFRVDAAIFSISARSKVCGSPIKDVLDDAIWQLKVLPDDIMPAFESTYLVMNQLGPLASDARAVLDDIVAGLQDFAAGVDDVTNRLHALGGRADVPGDLVKLLDQIPEAIWLAANDVRCLLDARVQALSDEAAPQRTEGAGGAGPATEAAAPARTGVASEPSRGRSKKKAKGREQGRTAAARSAAAPSARAPSSTSGGRAASAMVLGRSALGTRLLVEPEQAKVRGATAPPAEPLAQRLARMLSFDLPAQQRETSRARSACSPENAAYVAEQAAKRLEAQAAEMQACLAELGNHQERLRLGAPQLIEAHQQAEHLKHSLNQVKGEARSLMENMHISTIEHMKTYPFPTQAHIEQLRQAGALRAVDAPRTLGTEPATLFEIKIQPEQLRSGSWPRPMWVHLHTRQPVHAWQLPELRDADFTACHVKSDVERGRNRQWQNAQAAAGRENVMIYRGRLEPALCKSLMAA